jgi:hypothetical protein
MGVTALIERFIPGCSCLSCQAWNAEVWKENSTREWKGMYPVPQTCLFQFQWCPSLASPHC